MNSPSEAAISSPPGPVKATEAVRSGAAMGFVPDASRNENNSRLGPTTTSLETITGKIVAVDGDPDPPGTAGDAMAGGADDWPGDEQAARSNAAANTAAGRFSERMADRVPVRASPGARARIATARPRSPPPGGASAETT